MTLRKGRFLYYFNMKKSILFLLLLLPFSLLAKVYPGTILFSDGTNKSGLIEVPKFDSNTIKFKSSKESKFEKFEVNDVKSFEIKSDKNKTLKYITVFIPKLNLFKLNQINLPKKKSWLYVEKEGKISILSFYASTPAIHGAAGSTGSSGTAYFVYNPEKEYALQIHQSYEGSVVVVGAYKSIQKMLKIYFEEDCPKLLELVTKEALKKDGIDVIVDIYDANCG